MSRRYPPEQDMHQDWEQSGAYIPEDPVRRDGKSVREVNWSGGDIAYCAIAMILLLLILAGVLTFGIWGISMLTDIAADPDYPGCDDKNQCTADFYIYAGCLYLPSKNWETCSDVCLVGGEGICNLGQCEGTCVGNCVNAADCPNVQFWNGTALEKDCVNGGCVYRNFASPPPFLRSAGPGEGLGERLCRSCVHPEDPLLDCLEIQPFFPVVNPANRLDEMLCIYSFRCTQYTMG